MITSFLSLIVACQTLDVAMSGGTVLQMNTAIGSGISHKSGALFGGPGQRGHKLDQVSFHSNLGSTNLKASYRDNSPVEMQKHVNKDFLPNAKPNQMFLEDVTRFYTALNNGIAPDNEIKRELERIVSRNDASPDNVVRLLYRGKHHSDPLPTGMPDPAGLYRLIIGHEFGAITDLNRLEKEMTQFAHKVERGWPVGTTKVNQLPPSVESYSNVDSKDLFKIIYGYDIEHATKVVAKHFNQPKAIIARRNIVASVFQKFCRKSAKKDHELFLKNLELYASDLWLFAYMEIPPNGRNALLTVLFEMIEDLKNDKKSAGKPVVDLGKYYKRIFDEKPNEFGLTNNDRVRIKQFFTIVQNDFERLTKYLTNNYAQLFQQIAREGKGGIKSALIEYLAIWENATPQDQANLAQIWPRLNFFYNNKMSMAMNHLALLSAQGNNLVKLPLLVLVKWVFMGKPKLPKGHEEIYEKVEEAFHEDFAKHPKLFETIGNAFGKIKLIAGEPEESRK